MFHVPSSFSCVYRGDILVYRNKDSRICGSYLHSLELGFSLLRTYSCLWLLSTCLLPPSTRLVCLTSCCTYTVVLVPATVVIHQQHVKSGMYCIFVHGNKKTFNIIYQYWGILYLLYLYSMYFYTASKDGNAGKLAIYTIYILNSVFWNVWPTEYKNGLSKNYLMLLLIYKSYIHYFYYLPK